MQQFTFCHYFPFRYPLSFASYGGHCQKPENKSPFTIATRLILGENEGNFCSANTISHGYSVIKGNETRWIHISQSHLVMVRFKLL